jgi:hypothetical protein
VGLCDIGRTNIYPFRWREQFAPYVSYGIVFGFECRNLGHMPRLSNLYTWQEIQNLRCLMAFLKQRLPLYQTFGDFLSSPLPLFFAP